jgi:formate-dependent nitrite reductase membrane component NrfD
LLQRATLSPSWPRDRTAWVVSACIALGVFVGCDLLCFRLDHHYGFWATDEYPLLFLGSGIALGLAASALYATLLFTSGGRASLDRIGL